MTTTPDEPVPGDAEDQDAASPDPAGVEIGLSEEGSTFEPEEDEAAET